MPGQSDPCAPPDAAQTGIWQRSNLLGDLGGARSGLCSCGISYGLQEMSEVLGNVNGGIRRGADYDGMTKMSLGIDTGKAIGWAGATFNVSALQIHGRNLSTDNLAMLQTASEADRATRLRELWYQQATPDGRADLKLGQQAIDLEFMTSQGASIFLNSAMGWPELPSQDHYDGGSGSHTSIRSPRGGSCSRISNTCSRRVAGCKTSWAHPDGSAMRPCWLAHHHHVLAAG
jgi:porin